MFKLNHITNIRHIKYIPLQDTKIWNGSIYSLGENVVKLGEIKVKVSEIQRNFQSKQERYIILSAFVLWLKSLKSLNFIKNTSKNV